MLRRFFSDDPSRFHADEVIGPKLRAVLLIVLSLFLFLGVNGLYLLLIRGLEWATGKLFQNYFYQYMFLAHLVGGGLILLLATAFVLPHLRLAWSHCNRQAVWLGSALLGASLVLLASGVVLTRIEGLIDIRNPHFRSAAYWLHLISPAAVVLLFLLHRKAGRAIRWDLGGKFSLAAVGLALVMVALHVQDPRKWYAVAPKAGSQYFTPSLAKTSNGKFIPAYKLASDEYCKQCHADTHSSWMHSAHHLSSFNNPAYLASVRETREMLSKRDGNTQGSRFCAGCHDPAPFFGGSFDDPKFDDPKYDLANDPLAQAGISCTSCHSITSVDSPRGNADYTIEEPLHYPFAFSDQPALRWVSNTLIRANPEFHKKTFLKPIHKQAEFCGSCHKVHLPEELNDYRFLRGQNHYDSYLLSGVSGHGVASFYYPEKAFTNCNECHMPLHESGDFGARFFDDSGKLKVHDHLFPAANTALSKLLDGPAWVNLRHEEFNRGVMRVDLFGIKEGGTIDGELIAPLRPTVPTLQPGQEYLLETIIRTVKMGHHFTQGTADSNEIWLDIKVTQGGRIIGRSGGRDEAGQVDPWSHFVNAFVVDREGNRISRRNPQDIFVMLYNNQIPPGAGDVVHYLLRTPSDSTDPITVEVDLKYRKFDTEYLRFFQEDPNAVNDLPTMTLASDKITFPVAGGAKVLESQESKIPLWQRWNDYGISLLNEGSEGYNKGELRQADEVFAKVEELGVADGSVNRARVYIKEGRLGDAAASLAKAAQADPPTRPWTRLWLTGLVNLQNGNLDEAIDNFQSILDLDTAEVRERKFDFSYDYRLLNELGKALFERSKQERGEARKAERERLLRQAAEVFSKSLVIDPENVNAHYNLAQIYQLLGEAERAKEHGDLHSKYKIDDNARGQAIVAARRRYPHADHAAESIVIWDLHRDEAYDLPKIENEKE